jgi:chromosome segregation ATPase
VITIQSAMLITLGFLAASLLALLFAPVFWRRAVRLTTRRMTEAMPLTQAEIQADKDRLRAEHAIRVHRLENQAEQIQMAMARQKIDLSRRDADINALQVTVERLRSELEEAQNARRVLEQTVSDRLPRVEHRLSEARKLISSRDHEISELTQTADRQGRALSEAASINAQQVAEIERLGSSLTSRKRGSREGPSDQRHDSEVALRSELEALRAKTRDQSQLINRLQGQIARSSSHAMAVANKLQTPVAVAPLNGAQRAEAAQVADVARPDVEADLRSLKAKTQDQAAEIVRLRAAIAVFEGGAAEDKGLSLRDSKIALKARLSSLEAQFDHQKTTLASARTELAAANERLALQAAHFTAELKRLGAGTLPASGQPRRATAEARVSLADRVAQVRTSAPAEASPTAKLNGVMGDLSSGPVAKPTAETKPETGTDEGAKAANAGPERKSRLLDRISNLAKMS